MAQKRIPKRLLPHRNASVQRYRGQTGVKKVYSAAEPIERCQVVLKRRVLRSADEVTHISTMQVHLDGTQIAAPPVESLVTVHTGTPHERTSRVLSVELYDDPDTYSVLVLNLE